MSNTEKSNKKTKNSSRISSGLIRVLAAAGALMLILGVLFAANVLPANRGSARALVSAIVAAEDMEVSYGGTGDYITVAYTANGEFRTSVIRDNADKYHVGQHVAVSFLRSDPTKLISSEPYYVVAFVLLLVGAAVEIVGVCLALKKRSDEKPDYKKDK